MRRPIAGLAAATLLVVASPAVALEEAGGSPRVLELLVYESLAKKSIVAAVERVVRPCGLELTTDTTAGTYGTLIIDSSPRADCKEYSGLYGGSLCLGATVSGEISLSLSGKPSKRATYKGQVDPPPFAAVNDNTCRKPECAPYWRALNADEGGFVRVLELLLHLNVPECRFDEESRSKMQRTAVASGAKIEDPLAADLWFAVLENKEESDSSRRVALGRLHDVGAISPESVRAILDDSSNHYFLRGGALRILVQSGDAQADDAMVGILRDRSAHRSLRSAVIGQYERSKTPEIENSLIDLLQDPGEEAELRRVVIEVFGGSTSPPVINALIGVLCDSTKTRRKHPPFVEKHRPKPSCMKYPFNTAIGMHARAALVESAGGNVDQGYNQKAWTRYWDRRFKNEGP